MGPYIPTIDNARVISFINNILVKFLNMFQNTYDKISFKIKINFTSRLHHRPI